MHRLTDEVVTFQESLRLLLCLGELVSAFLCVVLRKVVAKECTRDKLINLL